jgi:hypothetical protein
MIGELHVFSTCTAVIFKQKTYIHFFLFYVYKSKLPT